MKDLFGNALFDYYHGNYTEDIMTSTHISDKDSLPLPYLFRSYKAMPKLEQQALQLAKGSVLDVGCGAGSHALWLQENGFSVNAIDISKGAVEVAKKRGVNCVELKSVLDETKTFDTILLLMNGTGIFKTLAQTPKYLKHLKSLLKPNGQILIDSSDISYMYDFKDKTEIKELNSKRYYGELDYFVSYKGAYDLPITWLYLDFDTLKQSCKTVGLQCHKIMDGSHYDYLAKLYI